MARWWRKVFFSLSSPLFCKKRRREKTIKVRSKCSELCSETIPLQLMVSLEFSTFSRPLSSLAKENCCLFILFPNSKCDSIQFLVQLGCDARIIFNFDPSQACRRNTSTHTYVHSAPSDEAAQGKYHMCRNGRGKYFWFDCKPLYSFPHPPYIEEAVDNMFMDWRGDSTTCPPRLLSHTNPTAELGNKLCSKHTLKCWWWYTIVFF